MMSNDGNGKRKFGYTLLDLNQDFYMYLQMSV
jgi:hypothetical protein